MRSSSRRSTSSSTGTSVTCGRGSVCDFTNSHLFLLEYRGGNVRDHDREVNEARWIPFSEAEQMLAFVSERKIVGRARDLLEP